MNINNATIQDQLSREEFHRIYANRKSAKIDPSAGYDDTSDFEQNLGRFIGKLDQIFGMCIQESTQDPNFTVNPSIEMAITSLPRIASDYGISGYEKIFAYYAWEKRSKLISKLSEFDANKRDELYIEQIKLEFKELVKDYIDLLKEYKKKHELNIGLEQVEIVIDDVELVEGGQADKFVEEVADASIFEATLKVLENELENDTFKNFPSTMCLTYVFKKLEQKLYDHIGADEAKKIIEKYSEEVKRIIQSSNYKDILRLAVNLFNLVFANHPNSMTPVFLEKTLAITPPESIALAQETMAMAHDEYMSEASSSIKAHSQSKLSASASEPESEPECAIPFE